MKLLSRTVLRLAVDCSEVRLYFLSIRAVLSLARLWQRQGKRAAAYEVLAPIYTWFSEGFDTADLQEAKALLEE